MLIYVCSDESDGQDTVFVLFSFTNHDDPRGLTKSLQDCVEQGGTQFLVKRQVKFCMVLLNYLRLLYILVLI